MQILDIHAQPDPATTALFIQGCRAVRGVVEHLNLEQIPRVVEAAGGVDGPAADLRLVVHGELNRDGGGAVKMANGAGYVPAMPPEQVHQPVAVQPVDTDHRQHAEVSDE